MISLTALGIRVGILLEELPLIGVGGEQVQRVGDGADRGVQRRRDVVDHQRREARRATLALVGGEKDLVTDAALDEAAVADHAAGVAAASARAAGNDFSACRFIGPRMSNVAAPQGRRFSRCRTGQPMRSGTTAIGNAQARSSTPSISPRAECGVDHVGRPGPARRRRCRVARGGAAGARRACGADRVRRRHCSAWCRGRGGWSARFSATPLPEMNVLSSRRTALHSVYLGQRIHPVLGQPHDGPELAQGRVVRIRVDDQHRSV